MAVACTWQQHTYTVVTATTCTTAAAYMVAAAALTCTIAYSTACGVRSGMRSGAQGGVHRSSGVHRGREASRRK